MIGLYWSALDEEILVEACSGRLLWKAIVQDIRPRERNRKRKYL